jgi:tRNA1(Val) A37 N6-methylase TrmN6
MTDLTHDALLGGRVRLWQPRSGYRAATDPVLLAAAVPARAGQRVLDLGCGAGAAALCLAARVPGLALSGLELQPAYAALARRNAAEAGVPLCVVEGDLAAMPAELAAGSFHHVIANPPWFRPGGGPAAQDPGRETAQREATPLGLWVEAGVRRLAPGGWLSVIHLADRLPHLLAALDGRMGSVEVKPLAPRAGRPAGRILLRARKGGAAPFRLHAPLILHEGPAHDGDRDSFAAAALAVLRDGAALDF